MVEMIRLSTAMVKGLAYFAGKRDETAKYPTHTTKNALYRRGLIYEREATDAEKDNLGRPIGSPYRLELLTELGEAVVMELGL